ncbi:MAG: energy-coupling factor transporter ATPase [Conexivisphaerales archaeon]
MSEIIKFENVSWKYLERVDKTLNNISFSINKGEFVVLAGPNDAGKTSMLMCMNGIIPNTLRGVMDGKVVIDGLDTREADFATLAKKVGYVFSDPESQFLTMTVEEEIAYSMENAGLSISEIHDRINWAMQMVDLPLEFLNKAPYELSGGQKQRVAIASVIAMRPPILVLDEPTSQIDPIGKAEVLDVISNIKRGYDMTVIIAEHRFDKLMKLADRILLIEKGVITRDLPPAKFFDNPRELLNHGIYPPEFNMIESYFMDRGLLKGPISLSLEEFLQKLDKALPNIKASDIPAPKTRPSYEDPSRKIIEMNKVEFTYPDGTQALEEVDLSINSGEFLALIGQNGSGKTTIAKLMAGILKPTKGKVIIDGNDVTGERIGKIASKVGYIFQNPDHQLFEQTINQEISYGPKNLGINPEEIARRVRTSMEITGIPPNYLEENPFVLSKGWRQKVAISSILAMDPNVIIVDEPTTGQDFPQAEAILEFLSRLNRAGHTIIVITHDMTFVAKFCRRAIVVSKGKIVQDGSVADVFNATDVLEATNIKPNDTVLIGKKLQQFGRFVSVNDLVNSE